MKIGTVVMLKSRSHSMTVIDVCMDTETAECAWFSVNNEYHEKKFPLDAIVDVSKVRN